MSPQPHGIRFRGPQQQRGAIGLMAALTLGMVLLFMLLVVDSGRLYFEQRKLQRVADVAVLEAITQKGSCLTTPKTAETFANTSAARNGFPAPLGVTCGTLKTINNLRTFVADDTKSDAIRVIATTTVPTSVAGGLWNLFSDGTFKFDTILAASAVGTIGGAPLAMLTIRSSIIDIKSTESPLLNPIIGGLLGGDLTLSAGSWKGLADADINLFSYLDDLIALHPKIGSYDELLKTDLHLTELLNIAIEAFKKNGAGITISEKELLQISAIASKTQVLKLGDLLSIQNGTPNSGLQTNIKALELIQGIVQLANGNSAIAAELDSNLLNLIKLGISLKVIEPPQMSAIGNPALIKNDYNGPNKIAVRTAQVQTRIHVSLPILNTLQPLTSAVSGLLSTVTEILKKLLKLDLVGILKCAVECKAVASLTLVSDLDIYLEAASADSYVTGYSCESNNSKSLTVLASTSLAKLSIGTKPTTTPPPPNKDDYLPIATNADGYLIVDPAKLISINMQTCVLIIGCYPTAGGGGSLNLRLQTKVAPYSDYITYNSPAHPGEPGLLNINAQPYYKTLGSSSTILSSLGDTIGDKLQITYTPPPNNTVTSELLKTVADSIAQIIKTLADVFKNLLSPLLDPIVTLLLKILGVSLGSAEIGANLSCGQGGRAQLVL